LRRSSGTFSTIPAGDEKGQENLMSKLADRIKRAARMEPAPLGFAAKARTESPSMLMFVRLGGDTGKIKEAMDKGADGVIVDADAAKLRGAKAPEGVLIGVSTEKLDRKEASALREAGGDFLVISETTPADALLDEKVGFVMEVSGGVEDTRLRLIGDLNLDAIIVAAPAHPLDVARLLDLRRIVTLGRAPLLVAGDTDIDAGALNVLRDSGAAGLIVGASLLGKLGELRDRIASLPARGKRRDERRDESAQPIVPASASVGGDDYEDDDF
jgi:hypothetical protein